MTKVSKEDFLRCVSVSKTKKEVCQMLDISYTTCNIYLKMYGVRFREAKYNLASFQWVDREWFIENWANTDKSLNDLSEEFGIPLSTLENRASRLKVNKSRKYAVNESVLFNKDDPTIAYIAGLIATDGYTNTNADFVSLTMMGESEYDLLCDIMNYIGCASPVRAYNNRGSIKYSIRISCKGVKEFFLKEFNIPQKGKTFKLGFPKTFSSEDCLKAYLLGCFDGDGCISHLRQGRPTAVITTASKDFIVGIIDAINTFSPSECRYYENRGYPTAYLGGKQNVLNFLEWMYSCNTKIFLKRKYEKFLMVKDIVCSTVKPE